MSRRTVQSAIGKLLTDEAFRRRFEELAGDCLAGLGVCGVDPGKMEIASPLKTDSRVWTRMAQLIDQRLQQLIDQRLQKTSVTSQREAHGAHKQLTERQQQVLRGVFDGLTNKEIAAHLSISESAVKATLQQLFRKMRVRTRAQLVRIVIEGAPGASQGPH
jgi:DNA-binding CsgD family transcriptional regulator